MGHPTGDPRNGVQAVHHQGAAGDELGAVGIGLVLRPGERLDCPVLREGVRARDAVDHQAAERRDEPLGQHAVAHAPSGHREGLAEAVQRDRALRHAGQGRDAERLALVLQAAVDLVGEDDEIVLHRELGEPLDVLVRQDGSGRVVRRVEDEQPRARRDQRGDLLDVHPEVVRLAQRGGDRRAADVARHRLVDREARVRVDDLVAVVDQGEHGVEHDRLCARRDDHLLGRGLDPLPALHVGDDRLAQRRDAGGGRVVRRSLVQQRPRRGLGDVARRVEVGLADLQVDHVAAGRLERTGARGGLEGGLRPDPLHAARKFQRGSLVRVPRQARGGLVYRGEGRRKSACREARARLVYFPKRNPDTDAPGALIRRLIRT